jgi:hypothetical protein
MEAGILWTCQTRRVFGIIILRSNRHTGDVFDFKFQQKYLHERLRVEISE